MPVYDRRYRGYSGERRSPRGLFWTLARFGLTEVFSKRLLLVLFIIACLPVVVFATLIYVANNLDLLQLLGVRVDPRRRPREDAVGDVLLLVHGGARPTSRSCSPRSPGRRWWRPTSRTARCRSTCRARCAAATTCWASSRSSARCSRHSPGCRGCCWSCCKLRSRAVIGWRATRASRSASCSARCCGSSSSRSPSLAISAWIRWRPLATGALFVLVILGGAFGTAINQIVDTRWGTLLMFSDQMQTIWVDLFAVDEHPGLVRRPCTCRCSSAGSRIAAFAALAALLLHRKIRAHEVIR